MPEESITQRGTDSIVEFLKTIGEPVTRDAYLGVAYPNGLPDPWTMELEVNLPVDLQDYSKVEVEPAKQNSKPSTSGNSSPEQPQETPPSPQPKES